MKRHTHENHDNPRAQGGQTSGVKTFSTVLCLVLRAWAGGFVPVCGLRVLGVNKLLILYGPESLAGLA